MGLFRMFYRTRIILLLMVFIFYFTGVIFVIQLMRLDSSQINDLVKTSSYEFLDGNLSKNVNRTPNVSSDNIYFSDLTKSKMILNATLEYVDWNDYDFMAKDAERQGWAEQGEAFNKKLSAEEDTMFQQLMEQYHYNAFASDHISLERSIGDLRPAACVTRKFLKNLSEYSVSIIIIFYNERKSIILRTLHSITNRSHARLLREIVIVDDASTNEDLKDPLENYIHLHFSKVKLLRNKQRQGLITSRMIGANASSGDILIFLDSHVEVNHNYLPPLIEPVVLDYRTVVCPVLDNIRKEDMKIIRVEVRERGIFNWEFAYNFVPVLHTDETSPHPIPAMPGGAFAISRKWWQEIKMYDPGLKIWGGEQYEMSFKIWQCGGNLVITPCSRVAHVFRSLPYLQDVTKDNLLSRNLLRVAKVWMDEYIEYVFLRIPVMRKIDPGDLTEQIALRKKLNCKSFKWYMTEVAPDIVQHFPLIEPPLKAWGKLKSNYNNSLCILGDESAMTLDKCAGSKNADYEYNWKMNIRYGKNCLSAPRDDSIFMFRCYVFEVRYTQRFVWDLQSGHIVNLYTRSCIDVDVGTKIVYITKCDSSKVTQSWTFEYFNSTLVQEAWEKHRIELGM